MILRKTYHYLESIWILDFFNNSLIDFHNEFNYKANYFIAHSRLMEKFENDVEYVNEEDKITYIFGCEIYDGILDVDLNMKIGKYSKYQVVYGFSHPLDIDECVYLGISDKLDYNEVVVVYSSDNNGLDENDMIAPNTGKTIEIEEYSCQYIQK